MHVTSKAYGRPLQIDADHSILVLMQCTGFHHVQRGDRIARAENHAMASV